MSKTPQFTAVSQGNFTECRKVTIAVTEMSVCDVWSLSHTKITSCSRFCSWLWFGSCLWFCLRFCSRSGGCPWLCNAHGRGRGSYSGLNAWHCILFGHEIHCPLHNGRIHLSDTPGLQRNTPVPIFDSVLLIEHEQQAGGHPESCYLPILQ